MLLHQQQQDKMISTIKTTHNYAIITICMTLIVSGCMGLPENIQPVNNFDINKYLGTWYEIARLDHSFERGLDRVTAEYQLRDDGGINVINRGFQTSNNTWKEAKGKAYFVREQHTGYLKVSFFGPFYSSYAIFELDEDYQYAFITSRNKSYLWLLSRTPAVNEDIMKKFLEKSSSLGFDTDKLVYISHDR